MVRFAKLLIIFFFFIFNRAWGYELVSDTTSSKDKIIYVLDNLMEKDVTDFLDQQMSENLSDIILYLNRQSGRIVLSICTIPEWKKGKDENELYISSRTSRRVLIGDKLFPVILDFDLTFSNGEPYPPKNPRKYLFGSFKLNIVKEFRFSDYY